MTPDDDPLYDKAKLIAQSAPRLCVANLQRTLMIGYNRAFRLMDALIAGGVVERYDSTFGGIGYRLVTPKIN